MERTSGLWEENFFALLALILSLLSLIVEVVRLTVEVMEKIYQKKNDDNKKD